MTGAGARPSSELAMADFFIAQSPRPWSATEVRAAFGEALGLAGRAE